MTPDDFLEHERRKRAASRLREIVDELDAVMVEMQGQMDEATRHLRAIERADTPMPTPTTEILQ